MKNPATVFGNAQAQQRIGLFGIPYDTPAGLGQPGARYAPEAVRKALRWPVMRVRDGTVFDVEGERLVSFGDCAFLDYGDIDVSGHDHLGTLSEAAKLMGQVLSVGDFPIAIGGDHSTTLPLLQAFHDYFEGPLGIIHVDAHLDLVDENPRQGRYSGSSQIRRAMEMERYSPTRLVQVGVRGFNYPDQYEYVVGNAVTHITAARFHAMGASAAAVEALGIASSGGAKVFLTIDIDVLDPCCAPGSGADEPGGLTSSQLLSFVRELAPHVQAMDVVEINPMRDLHDVTATVGAYLVMTATVARVSKST